MLLKQAYCKECVLAAGGVKAVVAAMDAHTSSAEVAEEGTSPGVAVARRSGRQE